MTDDTTTVSYKYNDQGIRTEKTVNGVTTQYNISEDMVTWEKSGANTPIYYLYDVNGDLWGLNYKGNVYFYVRNAQNDITKIVDSKGCVVVSYRYDVWGMLLNISGSLASTLGKDNPYRYRGYRYDNELGLYYLLSRYYNPEWCRFVNEDILFSNGLGLLASNMFAYCLNNPFMYQDDTGYSPKVSQDWMRERDLLALAAMAGKHPPINPSNYSDPNAQEKAYDNNNSKDQRGTPSETQKRNKKTIKDKFGNRAEREAEMERWHELKKFGRNDYNGRWDEFDQVKEIVTGLQNAQIVIFVVIVVAIYASFHTQGNNNSSNQPGLGLPGTGDGS